MLDKRTSSVLFTILVFALLLGLIYEARRPLVIVVFSILFAYLLEPLVGWFEARLGGSRAKGIAATYLILIVAISIFLTVAGSAIVQQGTKLVQELPMLIEHVGSGDIAQDIASSRGWSYETQLQLQQFLRAHRDSITGFVEDAASRIPELAGSLLWILLIPVFAVFVLKGKSEFMTAVVSFTEGRHDRRFLRTVLADLDVMLASFIRAQLLLAALSVCAYTLFLAIAKFPFSFPIAAIGGALEFIPVVGALASAILIMGIAVVTGYKHWLVILVFLVVWRGLQDYVNSPFLMSRELELHPFAVILGVLVGGEVAGVPGVFLSVPIMASLRIIWKNWEQRGKALKRDAPPRNTAVIESIRH